jgi:hypothetical protein
MRFQAQRFQFTLLTFLLACCGLGAAIGLAGRCYLAHPDRINAVFPEFIEQRRACDGFEIWGFWSRVPWEREQLACLLAIPVGQASGGGYYIRSTSVADPPGSQGLWINALGVFVEGKRALAPAGERIWIHMNWPPNDDVRVVPGTNGPDANLSIAEFWNLEHLELWKERIRPDLVRQSLMDQMNHGRPKATQPRPAVPPFSPESAPPMATKKE